METQVEKQVLVSVIVPIYKVEQYLPTCIEDILAQSYPLLDVILVNDGSPDRCGEICDEYAAKDKRISVIHQVNAGVSAARNAGLDRAKGDYIAFVDSDDRIHHSFIEELLMHIGGHKIVYCGYDLFDQDAEVNPECALSIGNEKIRLDRDPLGKLVDVLQILYVVPWNKLYARSLFDSVRYPVGKVHEDEFVIHELLDQIDTAIFIDAPLYYYRRRQGSITADQTNAKGYVYKTEAIYLRRNFFKSLGRENDFIALNTALLKRFVLPTIKKDNAIWAQVSIGDLFRQNRLSWPIRLLLLLKKVCHPLYGWLVNMGKRFLYVTNRSL